MIALYIFLGLIGLLIIYICLTSLIYKRSLFASIVAIYLLFTSKRKRHGVFKKSFKKYLLNMEKEDPYYKVETKTKVNIKEIYYDNVQTLIFNDTKDIDNVIIYYHGGAYISKPLKYHISFVDKLAINTNSIVIFPIYPKAPNHHYDDAIKLAINLYNDIINKTNKNIILMGDSSGGGLALILQKYLANNNIKQPNKTILLSPWVDLKMENKELKKYERKDPMLSIEPLKEIAKLWANDLPLDDEKISPIYGNLTNLTNLTLIVGTREFLYPDIILLSNKLKDNNVNHNLFIGNGMNHVFPVFPIKEASVVNQYIYNIINKQ